MGREGVELVSLGACVQDVLYKVDRLPGNEELSVIRNVGVRGGRRSELRRSLQPLGWAGWHNNCAWTRRSREMASL